MATNDTDDADENTLEYQFDIDRQLWEDWADTVPRSTNLDEALIELVEQDLEDKNE